MRSKLPFALVAVACLVLPGIVVAEPQSASGAFEAAFPAAGLLRLHLGSGDVALVGSGENKIVVRYEGSRADLAGACKVSLSRSGVIGDLVIKGCPQDHFRTVVQIPQLSNLKVRMPFGELAISEITGDKDVELHAGEVRLGIGSDRAYGPVDLSVYTGDLSAHPFGIVKSGLFRSYETAGPGTYRLHAHVGAGELTIKN